LCCTASPTYRHYWYKCKCTNNMIFVYMHNIAISLSAIHAYSWLSIVWHSTPEKPICVLPLLQFNYWLSFINFFLNWKIGRINWLHSFSGLPIHNCDFLHPILHRSWKHFRITGKLYLAGLNSSKLGSVFMSYFVWHIGLEHISLSPSKMCFAQII
jgi:hypothetical protein